jgi:hypothetical protein
MKHDERPAISPPIPIAQPGRDKARSDAAQSQQDASVNDLAKRVVDSASGGVPGTLKRQS